MLMFAHAGFMTTGFLLLAVGVVIARFQRKKRWWLKVHRTLEISTFTIMVVACGIGVFLVSAGGNSHLATPHAYIGTLAMLCVLAALTAGILQLRIRSIASRLRLYHRYSGYASFFLLFLNLCLGLSLVGVLPSFF